MSMDGGGLGATIRAWRDRLPPSAAGLPAARGRRAIGLRREDLAELAGVSVDYVVRLEQGRATHPSAQVVSSLARALQLTTAERDHLFRLARLAPPSDREVSDHVSPGVHRMLSRLGDVAVGVFAADWRMIWWNNGWASLVGDPSALAPAERNFARDTFLPDGESPRLSHWPVTTFVDDPVDAAVVADLRRATGRFPESRRLSTLIESLRSSSARFEELWSTAVVGVHREGRKVINHPAVGAIGVSCDVLTDGEAELKIVILSAAPGTEDEAKLKLALVNGVVGVGA